MKKTNKRIIERIDSECLFYVYYIVQMYHISDTLYEDPEKSIVVVKLEGLGLGLEDKEDSQQQGE